MNLERLSMNLYYQGPDPGYWSMVMHVLIAAMYISGPALAWTVAVTILLCVVTQLFARLFGR